MSRVSIIVCMLFIISGVILGGCSSQKNDTKSDNTPMTAEEQKSADWKEIENILNEGLTRLKYKDKSGLYELEFEYLRDEKTYDDYLAMGEIRWASMDTINHVEVLNIDFFDRDSAHVTIKYVFDSPGGGQSTTDDIVTVYWHQGKWIKPTVSIIANQLEYEEAIKAAEAEALKEAQGK